MAGGNLMLTSLSVLGVGGGIAWMVIRTVVNVENLTQGALETQRTSARQAENRQLDLLAKQLRTDRDHRTQDSLRLLRTLRDDFERASSRPEVSLLSARLGEQVGLYFDSTVNQLQRSYELYERSETSVGEARERLLNEREGLLAEIDNTLGTLQAVVRKITHWQADQPERQLTALQEEMERNLEIARRTEERMKEFELPNRQNDTVL
jgi:hypothetical protein